MKLGGRSFLCRVPARRPRLAFVVLALALLAAAGARAQSDPDSLAAAIKATYLYKFVPFVDWPVSAFPSSSSPVTLCVFGDENFARLLGQATNGQKIGNRSIVALSLTTGETDPNCQIAFVAGPSGALAAFKGQPVLTVTDAATPAAMHGIVNFVVDSNRVRFEIDKTQAEANGLAISSKLLSLAIRVQ